MYCDYIQSDIGYWIIESNENKLLSIGYEPQKPKFKPQKNEITQKAYRQIEKYFSGDAVNFNIPLETKNYTAFYKSVWREVAKIPYGLTSSYNNISKTLNNPKAVRAVGSANGKNPLPIIVPCHRVIGSNGQLTGYAFGLEVKEWLLQLEGYLPITMRLF